VTNRRRRRERIAANKRRRLAIRQYGRLTEPLEVMPGWFLPVGAIRPVMVQPVRCFRVRVTAVDD
jgi:hypothetical protein